MLTDSVKKDADAAAIKSAYRKLVLKCHPDKITDESKKAQAAEDFYNIQQAYEIIGDEERRSRYDAQVRLAELRVEAMKRSDEGRPAVPRSPPYFYPTRRPSPPIYEERRPRTYDDDEYYRQSYKSRSRAKPDRDGPSPQPARRTKNHSGGVRECERAREARESEETSARNRSRRANLDTMEGLAGNINGQSVFALCDTGADMNFVAEYVAKDLGLHITYAKPDEHPSFIMGHGRSIYALGTVKAPWQFKNDPKPLLEHELLFYVLKDCIFDVMIGAGFLNATETMTEHRYRLCRIPKPRRAIRTRFVNLCGTPGRRIRGTLDSEECSALPDSGAEPNLLSYAYVEKRGWLLKMFPGPASCRLLQFADGSTETTEGRLRLSWNFVTGWGPAPAGSRSYVDFDVLRGCPFDVLLGSDFLEETEAFTKHQHSFQEVVQHGPSGINVVIWVKESREKSQASARRSRREAADAELDLELERRAAKEWKATQARNDAARRQNGTTYKDRAGRDIEGTPTSTQDHHRQSYTLNGWGTPTDHASTIGRPGHTPPPDVLYRASRGSSYHRPAQRADPSPLTDRDKFRPSTLTRQPLTRSPASWDQHSLSPSYVDPLDLGQSMQPNRENAYKRSSPANVRRERRSPSNPRYSNSIYNGVGEEGENDERHARARTLPPEYKPTPAPWSHSETMHTKQTPAAVSQLKYANSHHGIYAKHPSPLGGSRTLPNAAAPRARRTPAESQSSSDGEVSPVRESSSSRSSLSSGRSSTATSPTRSTQPSEISSADEQDGIRSGTVGVHTTLNDPEPALPKPGAARPALRRKSHIPLGGKSSLRTQTVQA